MSNIEGNGTMWHPGWARSSLVISSLLVSLVSPQPVTAANVADKLVVVIVGKPGSGKTTQAKNISRQYRIPAWSMSDILEKESGWLNSSLKKRTKAARASGDFISDETANLLVTKYITKKKARKGFLLDGYPATGEQATYLTLQLREIRLPDPIVIHLRVPDDTVVARMLNRRRADDSPANIQRRMEEYRCEEAQILSLFSADQIHEVDGAGPRDEVWRQIRRVLRTAGH